MYLHVIFYVYVLCTAHHFKLKLTVVLAVIVAKILLHCKFVISGDRKIESRLNRNGYDLGHLNVTITYLAICI